MEDMKATELMIGDWVGRVFDDKRIDYRQVDWIRTGEIGMRYQKIWAIGCIEPIPLTPEILEKNGWHFSVVTKVPTGEDGYWVYEEGGIELLLHFPIRPIAGLLRISNKSGLLRIFDKWLIRRMPDFMWKDTLYVHELQHALRLCGLNELADNFKV